MERRRKFACSDYRKRKTTRTKKTALLIILLLIMQETVETKIYIGDSITTTAVPTIPPGFRRWDQTSDKTKKVTDKEGMNERLVYDTSKYQSILKYPGAKYHKNQTVVWQPVPIYVQEAYAYFRYTAFINSSCSAYGTTSIPPELAKGNCEEIFQRNIEKRIIELSQIPLKREIPESIIEEDIVITLSCLGVVLLVGFVGLGIGGAVYGAYRFFNWMFGPETVDATPAIKDVLRVADTEIRNNREDIVKLQGQVSEIKGEIDNIKLQQFKMKKENTDLHFLSIGLGVGYAHMMTLFDRAYDALRNKQLLPTFLKYLGVDETALCKAHQKCPMEAMVPYSVNYSSDTRMLTLDAEIVVLSNDMVVVTPVSIGKIEIIRNALVPTPRNELDIIPVTSISTGCNSTDKCNIPPGYQLTDVICRHKYKGPRNFVVSNSKEDCFYGADVEPRNEQIIRVVTPPQKKCLPGSRYNSNFELGDCTLKTEKNLNTIVVVERQWKRNIVYCPGNVIIVDRIPHKCPANAFSLPETVEFQIARHSYGQTNMRTGTGFVDVTISDKFLSKYGELELPNGTIWKTEEVDTKRIAPKLDVDSIPENQYVSSDTKKYIFCAFVVLCMIAAAAMVWQWLKKNVCGGGNQCTDRNTNRNRNTTEPVVVVVPTTTSSTSEQCEQVAPQAPKRTKRKAPFPPTQGGYIELNEIHASRNNGKIGYTAEDEQCEQVAPQAPKRTKRKAPLPPTQGGYIELNEIHASRNNGKIGYTAEDEQCEQVAPQAPKRTKRSAPLPPTQDLILL